MSQKTAMTTLPSYESQHYFDDDSQIRQFIKQQYRDKFDANIRVTYPHLIALKNDSGNTLSAIGYRDGEEAFFVEHYTELTIEDTLSKLHGCRVNRQHIVELGNLAATSKRHTIALLQHIWSVLRLLGYRYVVFSGTRSIVQLFNSLPYQVIANAEPQAVPSTDNWGSYYSHQPVVISAKMIDYDQRFGFSSAGRGYAIAHLRYAEIVS